MRTGKELAMKEKEKIVFIGGGNMAEALIKGLLKKGFPASGILAAEPLVERRDALKRSYGIGTTGNNLEAAREGDIVFLAIKPQVCREVVSGFAPTFTKDKLLVSILAGVDTLTLEKLCNGSSRVVRAMPNTPALIGEGATALCAGRFANGEDLARAARLFETVGVVVTVAESQMDAVTGLSGSGPAYVYTLIEALADGGVREGLPREVAHALAVQTVLGASRLVKETGEHPALLRERVCSPGGTTISGMGVLEKKGFRAALMEAVAAAARRSRELGGR